MNTTLIIAATASLFGIGFALCLSLAIHFRLELSKLRRHFAPIIDTEKRVRELTIGANEQRDSIEQLRKEYAQKRELLDALIRHASIYDETIELADLGFYKPHFDFDTSEKFKQTIDQVRSRQKHMVRNKTAVVCRTQWTVEGSRTKGQTMVNRAIRLTARAFNNECDAAISSVRWSNILRMEARIEKAFEAINKLNQSQAIEISSEYLRLKRDELRLTHEYRDKKQRDKEEQAELRRQIREEEKLKEEAQQAEKAELRYQKLLDRAKEAASRAIGPELEVLQAQVNSLEEQLKEAHAKSQRAKSMAEQTRRGHIYVISNIGSFGENVFKIGMTRRLDPTERVKELGDASVPFTFDTHAIIFAEDAPSVERELHSAFSDRRINLVNNRKEFFNVSFDLIAAEVRRLDPDAEVYETAEAREYRESVAIRNNHNLSTPTRTPVAFPYSI